MKKLLISLILLISITSYSQESKYSIELNFPIQTGDTFINNNYSGVIDIGFRARFVKTSHLNFGFHLNGSVFTYKGIVIESSFKTLYVIQPKIYAELNTLKKIRPLVGIGYTLMTYRKSGDVDDGPNISVGISYDFTGKFFAQVQYDLIEGTSEFESKPYNNYRPFVPSQTLDSDSAVLKMGLGYRL